MSAGQKLPRMNQEESNNSKFYVGINGTIVQLLELIVIFMESSGREKRNQIYPTGPGGS